MRKLLLLIAFLPLIAAIGHDAYNYYQNPEKGFHLADIGWIWAKYDPQSHQQIREELNTLIEESESPPTTAELALAAHAGRGAPQEPTHRRHFLSYANELHGAGGGARKLEVRFQERCARRVHPHATPLVREQAPRALDHIGLGA